MKLSKKYYAREELNGITVYEKLSNLYKFYENITLEDLPRQEELEKFFRENEKLVSTNLKYSRPFRLNWLIDERCNLDCIYCFADDKMEKNQTKNEILKTANHIKELGILNIGLSGGEPTLNKNILEVIKILKDDVSINIDTNGTIESLGKMAKELKEANVLVRITIDSIQEEILEKVRPQKIKKINQLDMIKKNIISLQEAKVPIMIHTVITQINKEYIFEIAKELISLNITRWHIYGVNYSEKCKNIYDDIKMSNEELNEIYLKLNDKYKDKINISIYFDKGNYSANSVILINSQGQFYIDSIKNGIKYIGKQSDKPTVNEINSMIDTKLHCKGYLFSK